MPAVRFTMRRCAVGGFAIALLIGAPTAAQVKPGDVITKDTAAKVQNLLSPGNLILVQQGMELDIVPADKLIWPPPYTAATEKYHAQVKLNPDGTLANYVAGQPFPLLDPNDPQVATKIMWNFSFRPLYSDDADLRFPEVASFDQSASAAEPTGFFTVGHFAFYNNVGRIEVSPVPTDPDGAQSGIRYRFGFYPFLEPGSLRGFGMIRYRHIDPKVEDNTWVFNPQTRRVRRESVERADRRYRDAAGILGWRGRWGRDGRRGGWRRRHAAGLDAGP